MVRSLVRTFTSLLAVTVLGLSPLASQTIPLRTVPVASGDQFRLFPSATASMGGVRLAVDDSLADPWSNPALGTFMRESAFLGSPAYYSISDGGGGGRTFPVAGHFVGTRWFGGASLALQQIDNDPGPGRFVAIGAPEWGGRSRTRLLSDVSSRNLYASAFLGARLGTGPWSLGFGVSGGQLDAMDGVDLLYAGADRIEQSGSVGDMRLGLSREGERDRVSVLFLHSRVSMEHDVTYVDWFWDDAISRPWSETRFEHNEDRTRTWGGQLSWNRALDAPGWRLGASGTVNRKSHPKIPDYEIQNIPRDPGTTWAYEAAIGIARTKDATTFALDVAFQPIWSQTWQEADRDAAESSGGRFVEGDRTIENEFFFTNVVLRAGLNHELEKTGLQAGLEVRSYQYTLDQVNHVDGTFRKQDEGWMEWTPTFGAVFRFSDLDLRYTGRITTGTGRPGTSSGGGFEDAAGAPLDAGTDFLVAPEGPLTLRDVTVLAHQLSVRIPVR